MKALERSRDEIDVVAPTSMMAYLRARGWKQQPFHTKLATMWILEDEESEDTYEILLPRTREIRDFRLRMTEALRTLEIVEQRSAPQIVDDLLTATADTIRIRLRAPGLESGSLPLNLGAQMIQQAREIVLAAACGAVEPRPVYRTKKPKHAHEYLERVRLGQTESGSYVVKLYSPVPMALFERDEDADPL